MADVTDELVFWAFLGAGLGRLTAKDSVFRGTRNRLLRRLVLAPASVVDVAEAVRDGDTARRSAARQKIAEGVTCPSCAAFWCLVVVRMIVHPRRLFTPTGAVELFAWWGAAATITRAVP